MSARRDRKSLDITSKENKPSWVIAPTSFDKVHNLDTNFVLCPVHISSEGNIYHIPVAYSFDNIAQEVSGNVQVLTHSAGVHFDRLAENVRYMPVNEI